MAEFPIPSFLKNQSLDEIHERMLQQLPDNIDKSEGGHPWNLTRPTAYEAAYMAEFVVVEAIKTIFPKYAQDYADIMEDHAETRGIVRKPATYATGKITVKGQAGTEIPVNSAFSTASINEEPAVEFVTTEDVIINDAGSAAINIRAVEAGTIGNVPANTIVLKANKISGITEVTNEEDITGGTEQETIEALQARIMEYDETQGVSFVGSEADYKRWALEVKGTGKAIIIPAQDDTGLVTIVLIDANGEPANETLRMEVYNHIIRPDAPSERLAPINGGNLQVIAPETIPITISVIVELNSTVTITTVKENLLAALKEYMTEASEDQEVRYSKIGSVISNVEGVEDYTSLTINGGVANIPLNDRQLPTIDEDTLDVTAGTV